MTVPPALPAAALALAALLTTLPLAQAERVDHESARAARARGDAMPLAKVLALVERELLGEVIEVELDHDDGALVYEFELLLPDGRVVELEIDARSGAMLKLEGARLETAFRPR